MVGLLKIEKPLDRDGQKGLIMETAEGVSAYFI
jgi:hypothetical protein